jgi:hypothetical protein
VTSSCEVMDVAPGLRLWRMSHPHWKPADDWPPIVTSTVVEAGGEVLLIDPLMPPWHEERVLPALRKMLELPFEQVIISHGEPVHDRAAFERALVLPAWKF